MRLGVVPGDHVSLRLAPATGVLLQHPFSRSRAGREVQLSGRPSRSGSLAVVAAALLVRRFQPRRGRTHRAAKSESSSRLADFALPDGGGIALEVVGGASQGDRRRNVAVLLIHGSYRAAWCWEPHYLGFFREQGFPTFAISLKGQGKGAYPGKRPAVAGTLESHAADVEAYVQHLHRELGMPIVIVGHSFGGLIVQRAVTDLLQSGSKSLAGMVLLSSVPPSGNFSLALRYLFTNPFLAAKITWGFISRAFEKDVSLCRELFFDEDMPDELVNGYMTQMVEGCPDGTRLLDLRQLQKSLPVPQPPLGAIKVQVLGGDRDVIVDQEALKETAKANGVEPVILPNVAHDAMLGSRWQQSANAILSFLEQL